MDPEVPDVPVVDDDRGVSDEERGEFLDLSPDLSPVNISELDRHQDDFVVDSSQSGHLSQPLYTEAGLSGVQGGDHGCPVDDYTV